MLSKMASRECIRYVSTVFYIYFWACLVVTTPGVQALKFLSGPPNPSFFSGHFGLNLDINCTTDDPNATVTLLHGTGFGSPLSERPLLPTKLVLNQQVFTVLNLITSDAGLYSCKATDQSGNSIQWPTTAMLLIFSITLPKHFVLKPAKAIIVVQGQSGNVTCETEGASSPAVKLKWVKKTGQDSYQAVPDSQVKVIRDTSTNMVRAILQITNAKLSDGGTYNCTVTVKHLSKSRLMNIRIDAPRPPTIDRSAVTNLVIKEGAERTVKCEANGSPKPDVTWYREGKLVNKTDCIKHPKVCEGIAYEVYEEGETSSQHTPWTVGVFKIRSASYPRDQGEFKCVASNGNPPHSEMSFTFDVKAPPRIFKLNNQPTRQHQQEEGKETQVSCSIEKSNPLPKFKWYSQIMEDCPDSSTDCKPDEDKWNLVPDLLLSPSAATQTNKSILTIEKDEENTFYRCQANNSLGNDSLLIRFFRLAKGKKPIEVDTATKKEFNERSTLEMYCIDRSSGWSVVFFTKDNKRLSPGVDPRVNITRILRSGEVKDDRLVLIVKNLTLNDSGNYRCGLELDPSTFGSINITVKRLAAPNITGLVNQTVLQKKENGDPVLLKCIVSGNPPPTITWSFYQNGQGNGKTVTDNGSGLGNNMDECRKRQSGFFFLRGNDPSHLVICSPDYEKHQGEYHCHAQNLAGSFDKKAFLEVEMEPDIQEPKEGFTPPPLEIGGTLNLTCKAKGNPSPNVTWIRNSTGEIVATSQTNSNQLVIESMKEEDFGVYVCVASNQLQRTVVSVEIEQAVVIPTARKGDALSTGALVGIAVGVASFVLIILIICCILYRRQKRQIDEYKQLYFLQQSDYKIDPDRSLLEQCNDLPYDPDWEFPEERLILGNMLGAGAFGQVIQAEAIGILALNPRDKSAESFKRRSKIRRSSRAKDLKKEEGNGGWKNAKIPVAVKTLKEGASREEYKDLASELKILIHLGRHKNIVNLLGACTRGKRLMVIMEFAPHGSLLSFLRGKRDVYETTWTKTMNDPQKEFTLVDLVMIGFQVGRGMSFLASKKCVHRDLAARNILVGEDYVMKIADFGLARDIYKDDLYVKKTQGLLPVKWMAPESLFDRVYTEKTDVWSFGILLWEAFTLGGSPYPGLPTEQLLDYLSEGKRMDMPAKCPLEVYTIMRDCWIQEPEQRPKFTTLTERLAKILERNTSKDNPYIALMEEEPEPSQGYYLQPVDDAGIRDSKRYVQSPVHSPTSDTSEPPNFGDAATADRGAEGIGYDSPLPTLPPSPPVMSDEGIPHDPLPPIPPSYESASRSDSAGRESGIDVDAEDDGYIDDVRMDSPFLLRPGNKPVAIEMDKYNKVPETKVLLKGRPGKYETEL